ncbi:MAG: DMT family transporter [Gemmatimonadota bacterium]|nr:DMT family transporter [Gemmatimonadota bacterium]
MSAITPSTDTPDTAHRFTGTDVLLIIMAVIWGVNVPVVKSVTAVLDPLAYNAVRVTLAAVAMLVIAWATAAPGEGFSRLSRRDALTLVGLGVIGNGLYQLGFVEGVARAKAGDAALVLAASPAMIALIGRGLGVERVSMRGYFGIALSIAGIALVVIGTAGAVGGSTLLGAAMILAGSLCWAIFSVLITPYANRIDALRVGALTMGGGAVALVLVSIPQLARMPWRGITVVTWGAILYSGIGSLVIAYLFWQRGVRVLGPTRTAMYSNLQPGVALIAAWLALGEVPTAWQGVGAATIIAGVVMTRA